MNRCTSCLAAVALIVACGTKANDDAAPADVPAAVPQEVTITATEFTFAAPDTIMPGTTTFRLVNSGAQEHHVILARLGDGKTMADLQTSMAADPNGVPAWMTFYGAASGVGPGATTGSTVNLPEGRYALICFIPDAADGKPHVMKGMLREMIVSGTANTAPTPVAAAEIRMSDFTYTLPAMTAGTTTFKVVNDGPSLHEVQLVKLAEGATVESFGASMAPGYKGAPQGTAVGGGGAISKGIEQWWTVTLEPGNYLVTCYVPDNTGKPHILLGMVKPFTVTAPS